jgi:hypothetical protein
MVPIDAQCAVAVVTLPMYRAMQILLVTHTTGVTHDPASDVVEVI